MKKSTLRALLAMFAMAGLGALPAIAQKPSPQAAEGAPRAGHQGGNVLDRAYLIGHWTDNGDCSAAIEIVADGRFVNADGGAGVWSLAGNRLTLTGNAGIVVIRIRVVDRDSITVINADGSVGHSTRC